MGLSTNIGKTRARPGESGEETGKANNDSFMKRVGVKLNLRKTATVKQAAKRKQKRKRARVARRVQRGKG